MLENNTFITTDANGMIDDFHCSSDSTVANIGCWIAPNGVDLTSSTTDPFDVSVGDEQDPGSLVIQQSSGHIVTRSFQGVYTCAIQDRNGALTYHYVGIYNDGFNSKNLEFACISLTTLPLQALALGFYHNTFFF